MRKRIVSGVIATAVVATSLFALSTTAKADDAFATCTDIASCGGMDALVKAAQAEGSLNITTVLRNWADYGDAIDSFQAAFGIHINDDNPDGGSSYEINSIKTAPAASQPDVVDIGASHIQEAAGLFANYKVETFKDIPAEWKDPNGNWFGNYQGQIVIGYNTKVKVKPTSIKGLLNPAYKGVVGIAGDPTGAQEALISVFAADKANGGTFNNIKPGFDFYHNLKKTGNLSGATADATHIVTGNPKVWLDYSFNALGTEQAAQQIGKSVAYVKPSDAAVMGTPYIFGINANAPHPAAARLWVEFLMSEHKGLLAKDLAGDEATNIAAGKLSGAKVFNSLMGGQNIFQLGGAIPVTVKAMTAKKVLVPAPSSIFVPSAGDKLSPTSPSVAQQTAAKAFLTTAWPKL